MTDPIPDPGPRPAAGPTPDAGAANERTALAWQRTALGALAGAAVLARLTVDRLGAAALVGLAATLPVCVWLFVEGRGRYRRDPGLVRRPAPRGGRAPLALAVAVLASTELAALTLGD